MSPPSAIRSASQRQQNFGVGSGSSSVAVGDFNGDGKQDLVVANFVSNNVSVLLGDGAGISAPPPNFGAAAYPSSVAVGDFQWRWQARPRRVELRLE